MLWLLFICSFRGCCDFFDGVDEGVGTRLGALDLYPHA